MHHLVPFFPQKSGKKNNLSTRHSSVFWCCKLAARIETPENSDSVFMPRADDPCGICLYPIEFPVADTERIVVNRECGHIYHEHCIRPHLTESGFSCPECRNESLEWYYLDRTTRKISTEKLSGITNIFFQLIRKFRPFDNRILNVWIDASENGGFGISTWNYMRHLTNLLRHIEPIVEFDIHNHIEQEEETAIRFTLEPRRNQLYIEKKIRENGDKEWFVITPWNEHITVSLSVTYRISEKIIIISVYFEEEDRTFEQMFYFRGTFLGKVPDISGQIQL